MSPVVFRHGAFSFLFFSREEARVHVHVLHPDGEAKIWLDPSIEVARNHGLSSKAINNVLQLVREHEDEIRGAWKTHFER